MSKDTKSKEAGTKTSETKDKRWSGYYDAVEKQAARPSLVAALDHWEMQGHAPGFAADLGCGSGRDTLELLHRGWEVLASDKEEEGIRRLDTKVPSSQRARLVTHVAPFEGLQLPARQLINASFSLPFCHPGHFDALWQQIVDALPAGGLFAGQLFGDRDDWADSASMTFHTRAQLDARLVPFEIISLKEVDEDGGTATGKEKHWHYFEVIARKS